MKRIFLITAVLFLAIFINAQTPVSITTNSAGWKRVASINTLSGRGFFELSIYTVGGSYTPYMTTVKYFKGWSNLYGGLQITNLGPSAYWTDSRITYDGSIAYLELNFTKAISSNMQAIIHTDKWASVTINSGELPDGGNEVICSAIIGKLNVDNKFLVNYNGNVGIGTTNPTERLTVKGTILASKVQIVNDTEIPASDYVFKEDYKLLSIEELESFVKENKHLPEVPSAAEFQENGYSVGQMDDLLLRKIEELTLYVIDLQKQMNDKDEKIEELQSEVEKLKN